MGNGAGKREEKEEGTQSNSTSAAELPRGSAVPPRRKGKEGEGNLQSRKQVK